MVEKSREGIHPTRGARPRGSPHVRVLGCILREARRAPALVSIRRSALASMDMTANTYTHVLSDETEVEYGQLVTRREVAR